MSKKASASETSCEDEEQESVKVELDDKQAPRGDPEMIPEYVKCLLPMFCQTYQSTMIQSVKRSSLGLIKKMVHYMNGDLLAEKCTENPHLVRMIIKLLKKLVKRLLFFFNCQNNLGLGGGHSGSHDCCLGQ